MKNVWRRWGWVGGVVLIFPGGLLAAERFTRTEILMGNVPVSLTIESSARKKTQAFEAMTQAFEEARRITDLVSEWQPESEVSFLNRHSGVWVPVGSETLHLLGKALEISRESDGAFDITFPSCRGGGQRPCPYDYRDVLLAPELGLAKLSSGARIGVSGIAKGYIVDRMSHVLRESGFRRHLVNAGDLFASGTWEIKIRDPGGEAHETVCALRVTNKAVSTSGTYERGNHIVDPATHKPVLRRGSATVIADQSLLADAWAKVLFVLGPEKSEPILKQHPGLQSIFIHERNEITPQGVCSTDRVE